MAMHKNLEVGSALFTFHESEYGHYNHRLGREKYTINFKVLYVHNRRERTTGTYVPRTLIPTLDKLGIRYLNHWANEKVCAVGCRTHIYYSIRSNSPYPTSDEIKAAQEEFDKKQRDSRLRNEGVEIFEIDFVQTFKEKKMSNKEALFVINKPLEDYINSETYVG